MIDPKFKKSNIEPDMQPLDIKNVNDDGIIRLCCEILRVYRHDYKHALLHPRSGRLSECRAALKSPLINNIINFINLSITDFIKEVGDDSEAIHAQDTTPKKKNPSFKRTNRKR